MNNEYLFSQQVKAGLIMFEPPDISGMLINYEKEVLHNIYNKEFDRIEEYLSNLFFNIVSIENVNHLLTLKVFYTTFICDLFHLIRLRVDHQTPFISQPFALIATIQQWSEVSHFLSSIPWVLNKINEILTAFNFSAQHSQLISQTVSLIHQHIKHPDLSVQWLADQLGVTPAHLSYSFKQQNGYNLSDFIKETKFNAILFDIEHTNLSLREIAREYNHHNYSNFIRAMKKHCGITPTQYKKRALVFSVEDTKNQQTES